MDSQPETDHDSIYTSPLITCRPHNRRRHLMVYLVRVPIDGSAPATAIGVTVQNKQRQNIGHEDFVVDLAGSADEPMNTMIRWLTGLGFSIEIDAQLLKVFAAFTGLVTRVRLGEGSGITEADYCIPPSANTFVDELRPVTTEAPFSTQPAC